MAPEYDFIIVGGGTSGSLLASRLSRSLPHLTILLLDAGGPNDDVSLQSFAERHTTMMTPGYNRGYRTVPQPELKGREIDYSRGTGLGGSSAINFCVWTRGPRDDWEHWDRLVGGEGTWGWEEVLRRFRKSERFHPPDKELEPYIRCDDDKHGYEGEIDVGMTAKWDPTFGDFLHKITSYCPQNYDHNSGNPLGIAVCQQSTHNGQRVTAAGAYLQDPPENLHIRMNATVTKVLFEDKRAIGVEVDRKKITARKEIILSAGAIDTPKLLLLSGVGPPSHLSHHGMPLVHALPGIGQKLHDRLFAYLVSIQKPTASHHRTSYPTVMTPEKLMSARKQWATDQTGALASYNMPQMIGFIRSSTILAGEEFEKLGKESKSGLSGETKPTYEIMSQAPHPSVAAPRLYLATAVAFHGTESSTGSVTLSSSNPTDAPLIDPNFLAHPFDRHLAINAVREAMELLETPELAEDVVRLAEGPGGKGDEEILEYIRSMAASMWHPCSTVTMGNPDNPDTCVDINFRVLGIKGLRVVDMSVAPFLPSAHTQAIAYVIAETASEKMVGEYIQG
ncbi:hypothetical protein XPA_005942 [Xanthoria parietina]